MPIQQAKFCLLIITFSGLKVIIMGFEFLGREFWGALDVLRSYVGAQVWVESKAQICSQVL